MHKSFIGVILSVLASSTLLSSNALALNFTKIWVDWGTNDKKAGKNFAANPLGDGLYQEIDTTLPLASAYQLRVGGSVPITVIGSNYASTVDGPVSLNTAGDVTFQSYSPSTPSTHGSFLRPRGGQLITLTGASFGKAAGAPSINADGDVVFLSMDATGSPVLNTRTAGGVIGTLPSPPFLDRLGRPAINAALDVVSSGEFADGKQGLSIDRVGGGTRITISGNWARMASSQPQIANNGAVLFSVQGDPPSGQSTGQRQQKIAMPNPGGNGYSVHTIGNIDNDCDAYMNERLTVACVDGNKYGMFFADQGANLSAETTWTYLPLLNIGDAFDGSTLTSITLGDGCVQPDNSVIFHATLANGASGIYQVMVPEPVSISALGASLLVMRRRR